VVENIDLFEFIKTAFVIIMFLASTITAIGGAIAILKKWWNNTHTTKNTELLKEHEDKIKNHEERLTKLEKRNEWQESYISVMCESMLALLDHNINGNSIEKLKKAKDEMKDFLIKQGKGEK
jgi:hypothetical protein